ncbi:MAG TPA: cytochrome c biogenesis protein CcsA [Terriglobales bacterium]|jgi:heme exporter protein C|nr:cytochrome c biogenesis protein CcsA [Terriglobales bacterium]
MRRTFVILALLTLALLTYALYQGMVVAPTEQTMGEVQRIFYYHVPSAVTAFTLFLINFAVSIVYLVGRSQRADALAVSTAEVGVVFCTVVLVTGPLWARPVWGIWWTWDARLTSTLLLWLIYVSYLILRRYSTSGQTPVIAAVLAVFGFLDVPFVYLANRLFRTQHPQPVYFGGPGSGADPRMTYALLMNMAAFFAFAALVVWLRFRLERARQDFEETQALEALLQPDARSPR